jgi:hypothetical protein
MATLQLEELHCVHTQDPTGHDEIQLEVACDGGSWQFVFGGRMHEGEHRNLRTEPGIPFTDLAVIRLSEVDIIFARVTSLGRVEIKHPLPEHGPQVAYLPPVPAPAGSFAYRLQYDVDASEENAATRYRIELLSLKCDDAQGTYDRVFLEVNGQPVLGPSELKTGQEIENLGISVNFRSTATVPLREERGEDWSSQFTVRPGEEDFPYPASPSPTASASTVASRAMPTTR